MGRRRPWIGLWEVLGHLGQTLGPASVRSITELEHLFATSDLGQDGEWDKRGRGRGPVGTPTVPGGSPRPAVCCGVGSRRTSLAAFWARAVGALRDLGCSPGCCVMRRTVPCFLPLRVWAHTAVSGLPTGQRALRCTSVPVLACFSRNCMSQPMVLSRWDTRMAQRREGQGHK